MNNKILYKMFKEEHPETIGEKDQCFDTNNYKDWLEEYVIKLETKLGERQRSPGTTKQHDSKALHIADVRLSLSNIQKAARIAVIKTKKSKEMKTNKITERELELAERAFVNGAIWAKNTIENNKA